MGPEVEEAAGFRRLPTRLPGVMLIEPVAHADERGLLMESFRADAYAKLGIDIPLVQENHTRSNRGVLRGIHLQRGQAKLIRCSRGRIWDVVVDLRPESETWGEWEAHELDDALHHQVFVPSGFGHGFCVLSDEADVTYKVSTYYDPDVQEAVAWNDPAIGIDWPIPDPILSDRDRQAPSVGGKPRTRALID